MDITERDYRNVPFAAIREALDPPYIEALVSLDEAYYGPLDEHGRRVPGTGWRNGESRPWNGYDKQATKAESKALFEQLHGALHMNYALAFWNAADKDKDKLDDHEKGLLLVNPETGEPYGLAVARQKLADLPAQAASAVSTALTKGAERAAAKAAAKAQAQLP